MFHAPVVLTSKCRIHKLQTTLKITVSCLDANPRSHVALKITVGSCSTHQHLLKQQLAPWSVASEVLTSDPSCRVKFLGPNNATTKGKTQLQRSLQGKKMQKLGHVVVGTHHSLYTRYRVRWRAVKNAKFRTPLGHDLT